MALVVVAPPELGPPALKAGAPVGDPFLSLSAKFRALLKKDPVGKTISAMDYVGEGPCTLFTQKGLDDKFAIGSEARGLASNLLALDLGSNSLTLVSL